MDSVHRTADVVNLRDPQHECPYKHISRLTTHIWMQKPWKRQSDIVFPGNGRPDVQMKRAIA